MGDDDSEKYGRPAFPLSAAQRRYLSTGDTGSDRASRLEENIKRKKVDKLGERIDYLLSDVELLAKNGYLDEETWVESWREFIGFGSSPVTPSKSERPDAWSADAGPFPGVAGLEEACTYGPKPGRKRQTSAGVEVGHDLARFAHCLMLYPGDEKEMKINLVWGFIDGLINWDIPFNEDVYEERQSRMETLISDLYERHEHAYERDRELIDELQAEREAGQEWDKWMWDVEDLIADFLKEEGFDTWGFHSTEELKSGNWRNEHGLKTEKILWGLMDDAVGDRIDTSHQPGSFGYYISFQALYDSPAEVPVDEIVTKERVLRTVAKARLVKKQKLRQYCEHDIDFLEGLTVRNVDPINVLEQVHENITPSSTEIAEKLGSAATHQAAVTETCNKLAGNNEFGNRGWGGHQVLEGAPDGWATTAYGEVMCQKLFGSGLSGFTPVEENAELYDAAAEQADITGLQHELIE